MEPARQTSIRWPISLPWQLRWPPFCTALTPTVLPNSFGVPPDLSFPYLFRRGGYRAVVFAPLRCPKLFRFPFALFVGCSFQLFCLSLMRIRGSREMHFIVRRISRQSFIVPQAWWTSGGRGRSPVGWCWRKAPTPRQTAKGRDPARRW